MTNILNLKNLSICVVNNISLYVEKHATCGWYVSTSDGYVSDYFKTKKEAIVRRDEIKNEIKKGYW